MFLAEYNYYQTHDFSIFVWYFSTTLGLFYYEVGGRISLSYIAFPAYIPDFMAVCDPFIFKTFINPALHPTRTPPGKVNLGTEK